MRLHRMLTAAVVCLFAAAAVVALIKWRGAHPRSASPEPVSGSVSLLVVGVEGFEPSIVERLVAEGRLPTFKRLLSEGAAAEFPSLARGTDRRISWTSLVTGVSPERQGIGGLIESPRGGTMPARLEPASRTVDTVWTLLSKGGTPVAVLGWPGTWPVEQVNGLMVGPYDTYVLERGHAGRMGDAVHPPEALAAVDTLVHEQSQYERSELARFVEQGSAMGLEALTGQNYTVLAVARAEAASMRALARHAARETGASAVFLYLNGADAVSQRFWHYANPEQFAGVRMESDQRQLFDQTTEALGVTIERYYEYLDEFLADLLTLLADGGTIAVVSDHGYAGIRFDESGNPMIGERMHSERGFLILHAPKAAPGARVADASLFDVAPTIMASAGVPVPASVEGRVLTGMLRP